MLTATIYTGSSSSDLDLYHLNQRLPLTATHNIKIGDVGMINHFNFSDKSKFCMWVNTQKLLVERRHTALTHGVMVWGEICLG